MAGRCSKCGKLVSDFVGEATKTFVGELTLRTIMYKCPECHTILGVEMDPVALKSDIVTAVIRGVEEM